MMRILTRALCIGALTLTLSPAFAGSFVIVNQDGAGEGFNDATAATPVLGNSGTTLGQQRLNAFQAAANYWGSYVGQAQQVRILASMDPLACTPTSAVLGSAGATVSLADFPNAPQSGTWYPVGLANNLSNADQCPPGSPCGGFSDDIISQFNSSIAGDPGCLGSATWWYGVGGEIPANTVSFYETVLHEIGHGLGFSTLVDLANGTEALGMPDVYESNLRDIGLGQFWPDMTDTERRDSAIGEDLHWGGSCVTTLCGRVDSGRSPAGELEMYAPTSLAPGSSVAHWDLSLTPDELMEPVSTAARSRDLLTRELMKDLGWKLSELAIEPVGQVNANLTEDIAVLAPDFIGGTNVVRVLDGNSGATIQSLFFVAALSTLDMETIDSFAGTAANEVAVLLNDPVTRQSRIMIKDASSGALLNTLTYATTLTPIDFEVLPDFAGGPAPEIALLLRESTGAQRVRVMIKDAGTGATVRDQFFVKSFMPMDLEILPDFGGTSSPELAVLARNCADDRVQVLVKDADNGVLLNSVPYAKNFIPLDLEVVPDFGGTSAAELAVLARSSVDGSIVVRVKDSQSDATLSAVNFSKFFTPHQFEMVPHFGGSAAGEIALVLRQNSNGSMRVLVKDASTGATLQNMTFAANRFPRGLAVIPDISGNGVSEIGMLSVRETDNQKTAIIRDPSTNGLVRFQIVP